MVNVWGRSTIIIDEAYFSGVHVVSREAQDTISCIIMFLYNTIHSVFWDFQGLSLLYVQCIIISYMYGRMIDILSSSELICEGTTMG